MNQNAKYGKLVWLIQLSALVALLILFNFTGLGYIKVGAIEITLNVIPVAVAAIVLGPAAGAICGGVFGITSFLQCFGLSAFGAAILAVNPVFAFILCFVPRLLTGWLTALIFKPFREKAFGPAVPALCCPLMNTVGFIGCFLLLFRHSEYFATLMSASGAASLIRFVLWFVGINGAVEAGVSFVVSTAVAKALLKANKRMH